MWGIYQRRLIKQGFKPIESFYWVVNNYTGYLGLSWGKLLGTKATSWVDTPQLARSRITEAKKARLVHLESFPELGTLMD